MYFPEMFKCQTCGKYFEIDAGGFRYNPETKKWDIFECEHCGDIRVQKEAEERKKHPENGL